MKKTILLISALFLAGCSQTIQTGEAIAKVDASHPTYTTRASFYGVGDGFHGRRTASGERFNAHALTVAHRTYPMGTKLRLTNTKNNRSVIVRVNDRGPAKWTGRALDASYGTARALGFVSAGSASLNVQVLK